MRRFCHLARCCMGVSRFKAIHREEREGREEKGRSDEYEIVTGQSSTRFSALLVLLSFLRAVRVLRGELFRRFLFGGFAAFGDFFDALENCAFAVFAFAAPMALCDALVGNIDGAGR